MITDRLTKYRYFILYKKALLAEDLAYTFYKYMGGNHGLPKKIIFDQDKLFTFKFWKLQIDLVGTKHNLSMFYLLQMDEQMKKLNSILEQYL